MQLHTIKRKTKIRHAKRVGRGGRRGKTSGRGTKGQKARAGHKIRPEIRDVIKRIPKKRGYKFKSFRVRPAIVNLGALDKMFQDGDTVTPEVLVKKGLVRKAKGKIPAVKILGKGETKKKFVFKDVTFSKTARGANQK
ncbi:50S ribosomal protein L15 [Patescibacteria group bacterium]|nr:50S ribosomal protein L15 [Patescibacteria group bacterium]